MAQIDDDGWTEADNQKAEEPRSKIGDIYQLGNHRLMCGDSTDPDMVAALMDGTKADLVVTDPPYNIGLGGDESGAAHGLPCPPPGTFPTQGLNRNSYISSIGRQALHH